MQRPTVLRSTEISVPRWPCGDEHWDERDAGCFTSKGPVGSVRLALNHEVVQTKIFICVFMNCHLLYYYSKGFTNMKYIYIYIYYLVTI